MRLREVSTGCAKFAAVFEFVQDWASKRKVNYIMTHSNAQGSLVDPTAEIRFPGIAGFLFIIAPVLLRSEERRVGKEWSGGGAAGRVYGDRAVGCASLDVATRMV